MDKEQILLKSFDILSRDLLKNREAVESAIRQLMGINPEAGLAVWERSIRENLPAIEEEIEAGEFSFDGLGYFLVLSLEGDLLKDEGFGQVAERFANSDLLVDTLYARSPINDYPGAEYVVAYLIRVGKLDAAERILSALYGNERFVNYSQLWKHVVDGFEYGEEYSPSFFISVEKQEPSEEVRDFCISWIEKIADEEQQAAAMVFAMTLV